MTSLEELAQRYGAALNDYLATGNEAGLEQAYALGRKALDLGVGLLDMAAIHREALLREIEGENGKRKKGETGKKEQAESEFSSSSSPSGVVPKFPFGNEKIIDLACHFFAECLAPFEMTQRGFKETNERLQSDIAERKAAEDALRQSEERYRTLFDTLIEGFCIVEVLFDADDKPVDYRFLEINAAFETQTGLPDARGKRMRELAPDHEEHWFRIYGKVALTGEPTRFVNEARALGRWYDVHAYRIGGPESRKVAILFNDITESKRAEDHLKRLVADLKRSNYDLEQFAYISSHDLQEPLRQVAGFVEMLQRHYSNLFDNQAKEFFGFITEGTNRMAVLIKDLLTYSRVGRTDKSMQPVDLAAVAQDAMKTLRSRVEESNAEMTVDDLPVVQGNATMLGQLFQNLIGNALKFRGEDPPKTHIGCRREDGHWLIWVQDNGIGFAQESAGKIFEVFRRLHTRDTYEGTGIGLAICKRVVELHGGRIWAESEPGKGATFYFTLSA